MIPLPGRLGTCSASQASRSAWSASGIASSRNVSRASGPRITTTPSPSWLVTSATTGQGLADLKAKVLEVAGVADREGAEQPVVTTVRQQALAAGARDAFKAAIAARAERCPPEIVAVELRQATQSLAQLRGLEVGDRVLDELFARFCIGK